MLVELGTKEWKGKRLNINPSVSLGSPESLSLVLIQRNMIGIVPKYFQEAGTRFRV